MEIVSGHISIKQIINDHWIEFQKENKHLITRKAIIDNVNKILACGKSLGYSLYLCPICHKLKKVYFTCKSRFCSRCGKKATDQWIIKNTNVLPNTKWQHITFTMPDILWAFFWYNRHLFNYLAPIAANIIKTLANNKNALPGIFTALHTFGRKCNRNVHIHLSTTWGGINNNHNKWIKLYFNEKTIKSMWRARIVQILRNSWNNENLIMPKNLRHINNYKKFNKWVDQELYSKTWVVHLQKTTNDKDSTLKYLGRYLKRPPIGETRIKLYDGNNVTFEYFDHKTKIKTQTTIIAKKFIALLISHIPDKGFRVIRYYGFLANRKRKDLLPIVFAILELYYDKQFPKLKWRILIIASFNDDPLACYQCREIMLFAGTYIPPPEKQLRIKKLH